MTHTLHRDVERLVRGYARDLDALSPSKSLDARIDALVAARAKNTARAMPAQSVAGRPVPQRTAPAAVHSARHTAGRWAIAAALGTLVFMVAVAVGVFVGVRVERAASPPQMANSSASEPAWPPPDFALWPTDSVALKIPAEVSSRGTLVAVDGTSRSGGARYWVDIVVSNDGTVRIENVVPADQPGHTQESSHGIATQNP